MKYDRADSVAYVTMGLLDLYLPLCSLHSFNGMRTDDLMPICICLLRLITNLFSSGAGRKPPKKKKKKIGCFLQRQWMSPSRWKMKSQPVILWFMYFIVQRGVVLGDPVLLLSFSSWLRCFNVNFNVIHKVARGCVVLSWCNVVSCANL